MQVAAVQDELKRSVLRRRKEDIDAEVALLVENELQQAMQRERDAIKAKNQVAPMSRSVSNLSSQPLP